MTQKEIRDRLLNATKHAVPDVLTSVLAACEEQKGKVTLMKNSTQNNTNVTRIRPVYRRILSAAAALVVLAGAATALVSYRNRFAVASTVSLDVNPSVVIEVNKQEKVLSVLPLNEEGRHITKDLDFKGSTLDVTVNALVGSMLRNGYLDDLANSILVSVNNKDTKTAAALQQRLAEEINSWLTTESFAGAVLSQTVEKDEELKTLAETYGITEGKAQLIRRITAQNTAYTFESLVDLTINELNLLSESGKLHLENVSATGNASDKQYVGEAKAKEIALAHAKLNEKDLTFYRCEMEYENGALVYELDFGAAGYEYDYEVNAKKGVVQKSEKEFDDDAQVNVNTTTPSQNETNQVSVSEAEAKKAALAHANVKESELAYFKSKLEKEDGRRVYEIEFAANGYEYDYEVDAKTGKVVSYEREHDDDRVSKVTGTTTKKTTPKTTIADTEWIEPKKAKEIALNHAGVKASEIRGYEFERDYENGQAVYEIGFRVGRYEYEYEINAKTGKILHSEKDYDD